MFHAENVQILLTQLPVDFLRRWSKIFLLGDPLGVDPVEATNLPPLLASDDVLEVVRTKPVNEDIRSLVARGERYEDRRHCSPVWCKDVGVCTVDSEANGRTQQANARTTPEEILLYSPWPSG